MATFELEVRALLAKKDITGARALCEKKIKEGKEEEAEETLLHILIETKVEILLLDTLIEIAQ